MFENVKLFFENPSEIKHKNDNENNFEKIGVNHDFKKLEKEQRKLIAKKFSDFAKIDTPLTEKEILELEEYYNNTFI